ncbi:NAD-dependent epimerase/dehydratase family protein [[Clostridium] innocuum]|nr:NAD-dependent epimerase/dehydratase family protein [[Clostridium] innocuum]
MKRIGITGKGSYIGSHFLEYMNEFDSYVIKEIDTKINDFSNYDFSDYDILFHVAGIAHENEKKNSSELYFKINCDLAYAIAAKAKKDGVKQFIFMSSMSVYGLISCQSEITLETICKPNTNYGKSKLKAESLITELESPNFNVCILRPPMVYGENSPGNLSKLFKFVRKIHIFPKFINKRSSISIENLILFIRVCVDNELSGIFLPQDKEYLCTYATVKNKMRDENIRVFYISLFNPLIRILIGKSVLISKVFGDLFYKKDL